MRKVWILFLLIGGTLTQSTAQNCLPSGVTFTTQQQIDDFAATYPGCTIIQGNVTIEEAVPGTITSLAGLNQVTEIEGFLRIDETTALTSLAGLENLTVVKDNLLIYENTALNDLSGLSGLTHVWISLRIISNPALTNLEGLNALATIGGELFISDNENLVTLEGLDNLTSLLGRLWLSSNTSLTSLAGLENLPSIGGDFSLGASPLLTSIADLESLTQVGGNISIGSVPLSSLIGLDNLTHLPGNLQLNTVTQLPNLDDISNLMAIDGNLGLTNMPQLTTLFENSPLAYIGGTFTLNNCELLPNLEGLNSLDSVGGLSLVNNPLLTDLTGLETLTTIGDIFTMIGNGGLQSFSGLDNLATIGGRVFINSNGALTNLTGLAALTSIDDDLEIDNNDHLLNLSGVPLLTVVGGDLIIERNGALVNLEGLEGLSGIPGKLEITLNGDLDNLTGLNNLDTIGGLLHVEQNNFLTDISALGALQNVNSINLYANDRLAGLNGLEGLTDLPGSLEINDNNMLLDLSGLDNLTNVSQHFNIVNNSQLLTLEGLESLTTVGSVLRISTNQNLATLTGLDNLTSVAASLWIRFSDIEDLAPLANLVHIGNFLIIQENDLLVSLAGIENIDFTSISYLEFTDNDLLSICSQENICNYIVSGGEVVLENNAPGCNDLNELLAGCFADQPHNDLIGRVLADTDPNCSTDPEEEGIPGWLVSVVGEDVDYAVSTDSQGYYRLPVFLGNYTLNVIPSSSFWTSCFADSLVQFTGFGDTLITDFFLQPQGDCPYLDWNVTVPPLRICQTRTVVVEYCNYGAQPAEDAVFVIRLDPLLTLDSASIDFTVGPEGEYLFALPTVDLFECGQFTLDVFTDCEDAMIGDEPCLDVELISDALCAPDGLWDGSLVTARGQCENDSIYFELENIGTGDMLQPAQFRVEIVIDDIILMLEVDDYQLPAGDTQMLTYAAQGSGLRLEADQTPGHPLYTEVAAVVPNCEDLENNDLIFQLPSMDGDPFAGIFCAPAVNSHDPNDKNATPAGVGDDHLIDHDWPLSYLIRFQNTGNDVAYEVTIADTLDAGLDLRTLDIQGASHPFTWTLGPERALSFNFADILLPDSTTNEPASHGYVAFTITPHSDVLPGERIENTAHIYFDFNEAIVTNTVSQTIRKPVVVTSERLDWCAGGLYQGTVITQDTTWSWLTEYAFYDSLHQVHFAVLLAVEETVDLELPEGSYFQDILITVDTSFQLTYVAQNGCDSLVTYTVSVLTGTDAPSVFAHTVVYPNPTSDLLHVVQQPSTRAQTWTLRNALGESVWQKQLSPYEQLVPLHLEPYPAGIYWLEVRTVDDTYGWKIIRS